MQTIQGTSKVKGPATRGMMRPVLVSSVFFMIVTGLGYPIVATGVSQLMFHRQAQGGLVLRDGQPVGSAVIGQNFTGATYFHPRPSVTSGADPKDSSKTVDQPYNAAMSAGSNLGATSKKLIDQVTARVKTYRAENGLSADAQVPVDAVTASASGLDPDISVANALLQAERVAKARSLSSQEIADLIKNQTSPRQLGLLGDPRVNVLLLNLALDALAKSHSTAHQ